MQTRQLLKEMLADYPRIWQHQRTMLMPDGSRGKYNLENGTVENIVDFQKWVISSTNQVSDLLNKQIKDAPNQTMAGPSPIVLHRLYWWIDNLDAVALKNLKVFKRLSNETHRWHGRIGIDAKSINTYSYKPDVFCKRCGNNCVIKREDTFICIDVACKNSVTGEWLMWRI